MRRFYGVGVPMLAAMVMLAGCDRRPVSPKQKAVLPPNFSGVVVNGNPFPVPTIMFSATSFMPIPDTPCQGRPGPAVEWRLSDMFAGLNSNRRIKRDIRRGGTDVPMVPAATLGNNWPTNLDMDLSSPGADYVMVTVILETGATPGLPGVYFLRPRPANLPTGPAPTGTDSSEAVLSPISTTASGDYCGRTPITVSGAVESFSFGVKALQGVGARSLNIGLLVPTRKTGAEQQMWLPIFLDPNVRNEG